MLLLNVTKLQCISHIVFFVGCSRIDIWIEANYFYIVISDEANKVNKSEQFAVIDCAVCE